MLPLSLLIEISIGKVYKLNVKSQNGQNLIQNLHECFCSLRQSGRVVATYHVWEPVCVLHRVQQGVSTTR